MTSLDNLLARLDRAEARLAGHAATAPDGLTPPEPATGERGDAGQAWAHVAEFVPYWHGQVERVLEPGAMRPVSFGRVASDPDRLAAIEDGRAESPSQQMARVSDAIEALRTYLRSLSPDDLAVTGTHPTRGEMDVPAIVERFVVNHLEEHADQLDALRGSPR